MATHVATPFTDTRIDLDGNTFTDCDFVGCVLVYAGVGAVVLDGCNFDEGCRFEFTGPAANALAFLKGMAASPESRWIVRATFPELSQP